MLATIIPSGTGISTNTSLSIPPISNALASDSSIPGSLFCGSGSSWIPSYYSNPTIISVTFTASGQPSFTGTLYLYFQSPTIKSFLLVINQTFSPTSSGVWTSGNVIPSQFQQTQNTIFPLAYGSGATELGYSYISYPTMGITIPVISGSVTLYICSGTNI